MPLLTDDQWTTLIMAACDQSEVVSANMDDLFARYAYLLTADPAGDLRYHAILRDSLDLMLAQAAKDVQASEGGGQSAEYNQYFDHLMLLRKQAQDALDARLKILMAQVGVALTPMLVTSLTPMPAPYLDPGHPSYLGDPRYRSRTRLTGGS